MARCCLPPPEVDRPAAAVAIRWQVSAPCLATGVLPPHHPFGQVNVFLHDPGMTKQQQIAALAQLSMAATSSETSVSSGWLRISSHRCSSAPKASLSSRRCTSRGRCRLVDLQRDHPPVGRDGRKKLPGQPFPPGPVETRQPDRRQSLQAVQNQAPLQGRQQITPIKKRHLLVQERFRLLRQQPGRALGRDGWVRGTPVKKHLQRIETLRSSRADLLRGPVFRPGNGIVIKTQHDGL